MCSPCANQRDTAAMVLVRRRAAMSLAAATAVVSATLWVPAFAHSATGSSQHVRALPCSWSDDAPIYKGPNGPESPEEVCPDE
jgi:hypothetical protein